MISATITAKPHDLQRYNTVGDYLYDLKHDYICIFVSACKNPDHEFLVALHEFIEAYLAKRAGIPEWDITKFDLNCPDAEPGNSPQAPYSGPHLIATRFERLMAEELKVDWEAYEQELEDMLQRSKNNGNS